MKKSISILCILLFFMSFQLWAGAANETAAEAQTTEINLSWFPLWTGVNGEAEGTALDWPTAMGEEFMASHPEVTKINVEMLTWDNGLQKLDTSIAAGKAPDLSYIDTAWLAKYIEQDAVEPVSPYFKDGDMQDFYESTTDYCTYGDQVYAFPILIAPRIFYANISLLKEMGLDHLLPLDGDRSWTVDQFKEIAKHFPYKTKEGKTVYATQITTSQQSMDHLLWLWNFGADLYNDDESEFILNSPEGVASLDFMNEMIDENHFYLVSGGAKMLDFYGGEMAFIPNLAYTEEKANSLMVSATAEGQEAPEVVAIQFPRGPGVENAYTYSGIGGLAVFKQPEASDLHTKAVMEFASFLSNAENAKIVKVLGCFPPRRSSGDVFGGDVNAEVARSMMPFGQDLGRGVNTDKIFLNLLNPAFESVFFDKKTSMEALNNLAVEANKLLSEK